MTRQYPLPLPHHEAMDADDFMITSSNQDAVAWVNKWPEWPSHCLVIFGPAGSGKTHLANMWASHSKGSLMSLSNLNDISLSTLGAGMSIALDNAESVAQHAEKEELLLHLFNLLRETRGFLLMTAHDAPAQWNIKLPDLRSRLMAATAVALAAPDDTLISSLLIKQLDDRQIEVGSGVLDYLLPRVTRTPDAIRSLVAALDKASLAEGRGITVALAKSVLTTLSAASSGQR